MNLDKFKSIILKHIKNSNGDFIIGLMEHGPQDVRLSFRDAQTSNMAREKGNELYAQSNLDKKQLHEILRFYNESIAYAPIESEEKAKALSNKAALLLRMRKYRESICEVDKALKITRLIPLKVKLLCRKAESLSALGSPESRSCLEKAKFILSKSKDSNKTNELLLQSIKKLELVIDREKLDTPKENKRKIEVSKLIAEAEKRGISNSVEIRHSKIYGTHIVAAQDYEPGDIVVVEKPFKYQLLDCMADQYCYHCINYLWTIVPCDHCHYRSFCSEECKNQAWNEYHDLECNLVSRMKFILNSQWNDVCLLILSFFCKMLKEAGSVEKLQAYCESATNEDPPSNGFSYKTILALSTWDLTQEELEVYVPCSTYVLFGLARFTKIFKKTYHFNEIEELIVKNAVAGFAASFLLKICTLFNAGCSLLRLIDPIEEDGSEKELRNINGAALNLFRCSVFNVSTMLTSIGCIPNVLSHRTIDHKFVILALLPIKKGTRLILFGQSNPSIFDSKPKSERQSMHYNYYKCPCICQACTEDWPVDFNELNTKTVDYSDCELQELEKFRNDLKSVMNQWNTHLLARKPNYPDIKTVNKVKSLVTASWKYFPLPSIMMIVSANLMVTILGCFYHPDKNMFTSSLSAYNIDTVKVT